MIHFRPDSENDAYQNGSAWVGIAFTQFVAGRLSDFVPIDVGAAGGLAPGWRSFGYKLRGYGFDPDAAETERLNAVGAVPGLRYVSGYVGLPPGDPFAAKRRGTPRAHRSPWPRLAVDRWLNIQYARDEGRPVPPNLPRPLPRGDDSGENSGEFPSIINLPRLLAGGRRQHDRLP
jgi:hypothetical protein